MITKLEAELTPKVLEQYVLYKRLRNEWYELGNKKMVRFFNKRMAQMRLVDFVYVSKEVIN